MLQHLSYAVQLGFDRRPQSRIFEVLHHKASRDFEAALFKLSRKEFGFERQVARRTEFDPFVVGQHYLIEKPLPWNLFGIAGKPDAPIVRCSADFDVDTHQYPPTQNFLRMI